VIEERAGAWCRFELLRLVHELVVAVAPLLCFIHGGCCHFVGARRGEDDENGAGAKLHRQEGR